MRHPTVQVGVEEDDVSRVGLLGVLNGLCGAYTRAPARYWGPIAAVFDEDSRFVVEFRRTDRDEVERYDAS